MVSLGFVKIVPDADYLNEWKVRIALNGFKTLDKETATTEMINHVAALNKYLTAINSVNDFLPELVCEGSEFGIRLKTNAIDSKD